jgi:uncharacterized protein YndB with AHSA1/START domain
LTSHGRPRPDPHDLGELDQRDGLVQVTFTRRIPFSPQRVWRALTEPRHLAAWFPTTIEGERTPGARLRFCFREDEAPPFDGEMVAFDPPSLMEFRWGDEVLRFEVRPDGAGSVVRFIATFEELGKAARDGAGWHTCLDLFGYEVAGKVAPWTSAQRWSQVRTTYIDRFGPDASTIGPPEEQ